MFLIFKYGDKIFFTLDSDPEVFASFKSDMGMLDQFKINEIISVQGQPSANSQLKFGRPGKLRKITDEDYEVVEPLQIIFV